MHLYVDDTRQQVVRVDAAFNRQAQKGRRFLDADAFNYHRRIGLAVRRGGRINLLNNAIRVKME